jgi:hypothetical protein
MKIKYLLLYLMLTTANAETTSYIQDVIPHPNPEDVPQSVKENLPNFYINKINKLKGFNSSEDIGALYFMESGTKSKVYTISERMNANQDLVIHQADQLSHMVGFLTGVLYALTGNPTASTTYYDEQEKP